MSTDTKQAPITIERTVWGSIEDVWDLWTTKEGLESWWGPAGFSTTVTRLEVRPGGVWEYVMTATDPEQVEAMKAAGMPVSSTQLATYTEVALRRRLAYEQAVDSVPDVKPYRVQTSVDLLVEGNRVRIALTTDPMHEPEWTESAVYGYTSTLERLEKLLEARRTERAKA